MAIKCPKCHFCVDLKVFFLAYVKRRVVLRFKSAHTFTSFSPHEDIRGDLKYFTLFNFGVAYAVPKLFNKYEIHMITLFHKPKESY